MPNINVCIIAGHLTRDPELSYTPSGTAVCKGGIAVDSGWGDKVRTCFIDYTIFGKTAESFKGHCRKGAAMLFEAQLNLEQWTDKNNNKRSRHSLLVNRWQFAGPKPQDRQDSADAAIDNTPDPDLPF